MIFEWTRFFTRTGTHPRVKPEDMLRSTTPLRARMVDYAPALANLT
jgi:hypothetical protein